MKIAVAQFAAGPDEDANLEACRKQIASAADEGADLVVLPEVVQYFDPKRTAAPGPHGQPLDGPFATELQAAAAARGVAVIVGMLERPTDGASAADQRDWNTALVIDADGQVAGAYRKVHLYDAFGFRESDIYRPGPIASPVTVRVADVTVGVLTCYDLRFPEAFRWVVDAGVDVVALPSAWMAGPGKEDHWATLLRARAIENTVYVAGAGQTGPACCGRSMVIDPMGVTLAGAGVHPGIATAEVDPAQVAAVRAINPSLENRRFAVIPRSE